MAHPYAGNEPQKHHQRDHRNNNQQRENQATADATPGATAETAAHRIAETLGRRDRRTLPVVIAQQRFDPVVLNTRQLVVADRPGRVSRQVVRPAVNRDREQIVGGAEVIGLGGGVRPVCGDLRVLKLPYKHHVEVDAVSGIQIVGRGLDVGGVAQHPGLVDHVGRPEINRIRGIRGERARGDQHPGEHRDRQ